jgi:hypothetical protein
MAVPKAEVHPAVRRGTRVFESVEHDGGMLPDIIFCLSSNFYRFASTRRVLNSITWLNPVFSYYVQLTGRRLR